MKLLFLSFVVVTCLLPLVFATEDRASAAMAAMNNQTLKAAAPVRHFTSISREELKAKRRHYTRHTKGPMRLGWSKKRDSKTSR